MNCLSIFSLCHGLTIKGRDKTYVPTVRREYANKIAKKMRQSSDGKCQNAVASLLIIVPFRRMYPFCQFANDRSEPKLFREWNRVDSKVEGSNRR